ncbi:MAG: cytidine deaminase [Pseudomonadota bacterium]
MTISQSERDALIEAAKGAAEHAYAPYSDYQVGAALLFDDGAVVTGANVENASYGLALCAETNAVSKAMNDGRRGGLIAVAVIGPEDKGDGAPITPCGRCRQVLHELAALGGTNPIIYCVGTSEVRDITLSQLLPHAFGPESLV